MNNIIFYTNLGKIIGCTRDNEIKGEPFCDSCTELCELCSFKGQYKKNIQEKINNESHLKATFIRLYLEKIFSVL